MMLKKMKKRTVLQLAALLAVVAFAMMVGACSSDDPITTIEDEKNPFVETGDPVNYQTEKTWGTSFTPETLGLTPGKDNTEINLNWYSDTGTSNNQTHVRFIRGTLIQGYAIHEVTVQGDAPAASAGKLAHKATVTGLKPGFSYQYSVSNDGTNWSPMYDFKIPQPTGSWSFAVIADPQLWSENNRTPANNNNWDPDNRYTPAGGAQTRHGWLETMTKIVAKGVSFIASGGDQVDQTSGGNEDEYTMFFAPAGMKNLPLAPVSGNHDAHNPFMYHYNLPNEQVLAGGQTDIQKMGNYFYLYNNILFVVLNTAPYPTSTVEAGPYIAFFRQTLTAAKEAHPTGYDWLIVQHHKSTASVGDHLADRDIQYYVEAGFETLMSEFKVDFVLAGHDHVYARSYPLKGMADGLVSVPNKNFASASGSTWNNPQDPVYLTFTTGSGLKYYSVAADPTYNYNNSLYVQNNTEYPYLGESTADNKSTYYGSTAYMNQKMLPVSNAAYVQPYIPSYCIVEVNGRSITFSTYPIATVSNEEGKPGYKADGPTRSFDAGKWAFDSNTPYDKITVTK